jgi:hypothetical protein
MMSGLAALILKAVVRLCGVLAVLLAHISGFDCASNLTPTEEFFCFRPGLPRKCAVDPR